LLITCKFQPFYSLDFILNVDKILAFLAQYIRQFQVDDIFSMSIIFCSYFSLYSLMLSQFYSKIIAINCMSIYYKVQTLVLYINLGPVVRKSDINFTHWIVIFSTVVNSKNTQKVIKLHIWAHAINKRKVQL
jgi:hypothetical protein